MQPREVVFVDGLVDRQVAQQFIQAAVACLAACRDVGGFAGEVLAACRAAHGTIERRAAVAAVHVNGCAVCFAQRVEDIGNELFQVGCGLPCGGVVDTEPSGGGRPCEFVEGKMFHGFLILSIILFKSFSFSAFRQSAMVRAASAKLSCSFSPAFS